MRKGELSEKILECLEDAVSAAGFLFDVFTSGYAESYRKMRGIPEKQTHRSSQKLYELEKKKEEEKRFRNVLYRLRAQKFIERNDAGWKITKKGKEKLALLRKQKENAMPGKSYARQPSSNPILIIFDIPEKYRKKRDWFRITLRALGFSLLQKSVWVGRYNIPKELLQDLKDLELLRYIQIFSINKPGTIQTRLKSVKKSGERRL